MKDDQLWGWGNHLSGFLNYRMHKTIRLYTVTLIKGTTLGNERLWNIAKCFSSVYCQRVVFHYPLSLWVVE